MGLEGSPGPLMVPSAVRTVPERVTAFSPVMLIVPPLPTPEFVASIRVPLSEMRGANIVMLPLLYPVDERVETVVLTKSILVPALKSTGPPDPQKVVVEKLLS